MARRNPRPIQIHPRTCLCESRDDALMVRPESRFQFDREKFLHFRDTGSCHDKKGLKVSLEFDQKMCNNSI